MSIDFTDVTDFFQSVSEASLIYFALIGAFFAFLFLLIFVDGWLFSLPTEAGLDFLI